MILRGMVYGLPHQVHSSGQSSSYICQYGPFPMQNLLTGRYHQCPMLSSMKCWKDGRTFIFPMSLVLIDDFLDSFSITLLLLLL